MEERKYVQSRAKRKQGLQEARSYMKPSRIPNKNWSRAQKPSEKLRHSEEVTGLPMIHGMEPGAFWLEREKRLGKCGGMGDVQMAQVVALSDFESEHSWSRTRNHNANQRCTCLDLCWSGVLITRLRDCQGEAKISQQSDNVDTWHQKLLQKTDL